MSIAARHADIFQFTGLTHGEGGKPAPEGFAIDAVRERSKRLQEAAGDRHADIERSALVQIVHVGMGADEHVEANAQRFGVSRELIHETPFLLIGSVERIVDKLERLRRVVGISHVVVRDAEGFAPVVVDVIRAFTTAAYAFAAGASHIVVVDSVAEALSLKGANPGTLAMGEDRVASRTDSTSRTRRSRSLLQIWVVVSWRNERRPARVVWLRLERRPDCGAPAWSALPLQPRRFEQAASAIRRM